MKRLLFTAIAAISAAQALAVDVTFEAKATTLDKALDALSKANNIQIKAVGPIARQVVVISVEKQPLEAFLKHISTALSATVQERGGVYEVSESASLIKAEDDAARARLAKAYAKSLAQQSKGLDGPAITEADLSNRLSELRAVMDQIQNNPDRINNDLYEKVQGLHESMPTAQLVRRLLASIPAADLAALPSNQRVVFATSPTRMQKPLGPKAQAVLSSFATEYSRMSAVVGRFPVDQQQELMSMMGSYFAKGVPAKFLLSCTRYSGNNLSIEVQVLDANSRVLSVGNGSLSGSETEERSDKNPAFEAAKDEQPLKMSEESKTYHALMTRGIDGAKPGVEVVPEPLRSKVLNPEEHDPLSFGISDLILAAAKDRKKPAIFVVPDSAQSFDASSNLKASDFFTLLGQMDQINVELIDGWYIGRPVFPIENRSLRVNRMAYGNLVRQIAKNGHVSLADLSTFAIAQGLNPGHDSFYIQNLYSLFGSLLAGYDLSNWEGLRFYGYLGETNRKRMDGATVTFQSMPKEAQNEIAKMVYSQGSSLGVPFDAEPMAVPLTEQESMVAMPCMDPTERLPNGIPPDAQVQLMMLDEPVLVPEAGGFGVPLSASELASQIAMEERPDLFPWAQENKVSDRFRASNRVTMTFDFLFTPKLGFGVHLTDYRAASGQPFGRNNFPDGFRQQFDQMLKEMRESFKGMKPQDVRRSGGGPPPAP